MNIQSFSTGSSRFPNPDSESCGARKPRICLLLQKKNGNNNKSNKIVNETNKKNNSNTSRNSNNIYDKGNKNICGTLNVFREDFY